LTLTFKTLTLSGWLAAIFSSPGSISRQGMQVGAQKSTMTMG